MLALERGGRVDGERLAVVDDRDPLAQDVRLLHVVRREERRLAGAVEVFEDAPEVDARLRVDAGRRLVEEEHLRLVDERAGDHQPLREAAGELEDHRAGAVGERELLEQLVRPRAGLRARHAEEAAVVVEVLPDGERAVERVRLRDDADLALDGGRVAPDVEAGDERPALRRDDRRRQHPDRRRLAGPVRAEQAEELAAADLEVEPVDGNEVAVDLAELFGADGRGFGGDRPSLAAAQGHVPKSELWAQLGAATMGRCGRPKIRTAGVSSCPSPPGVT